jgi:hypothetical protein
MWLPLGFGVLTDRVNGTGPAKGVDMAKVRLLTDVGAGVAGVAALATSGALVTACTTSATPADSAANADTASLATGSGTISLDWEGASYASSSGGDEFVRVGERLTVEVSFSEFLDLLNNHDAGASERIANDPSKVDVSIRVSYRDLNNAEKSSELVPVTFGQTGTETAFHGTSGEFTVAKAPRMVLQYVAVENGQTHTFDTSYQQTAFPVFGAFPGKVVLFDNDGNGNARQRIVEGGTLTPGQDVTLSYTDWRADHEVDKASLQSSGKLNIGKGDSYSRFGPSQIDVQGQFSYEISFTYSTDGGQTWVNGGTLDKHDNPAVLSIPAQYGRSSYEKTFRLPADAKDLRVAFHVKGILVADPHYVFINQWYTAPDGTTFQLGKSYQLADVWDNAGVPNGSYDLEASR